MPVVSREGDGKHILGAVLEPAGGLAGGQVLQSQGLVPGAGQGKVSVRGKNLSHRFRLTIHTSARSGKSSNLPRRR